MKKFLLTLSLVLTAFAAYAQSFDDGPFNYSVNGDGTSVTLNAAYTILNGGNTDLVIPEKVTYEGTEYTVTGVKQQAFTNSNGGVQVTSIVFPNSITTLDRYAFYYCNALKSATFGDGITDFPTQVFAYCSALEELTFLGTNVASINYYFSNCRVGGTLQKTVKKITLYTTTPPTSGGYAFQFVADDAEVFVPAEAVEDYKANSIWSKYTIKAIGEGEGGGEATPVSEFIYEGIKYTVAEGTTNATIAAPTDATGNVVIPDTIDYEGIKYAVVAVGESAFSGNTTITSVTLPEGITSIGKEAFKSSAITSMVIPNSVTSLGANAFNLCTALTSLDFGDGLTTFDEYCFSSCSALESVSFGTSFTSIPSGYPFMDTAKISKVACRATTPPTCASDYVFYGVTSDATLSVPAESVDAYKAATGWKTFTTVSAIDEGGEGGSENGGEVTPITEFTYEGILYTIQEGSTNVVLSDGKSVSGDITIPNPITYEGTDYTVVAVGWEAFLNNKDVTSVSLPETVTELADWAFTGSGITTMTLPNSVTMIQGSHAFQNCESLEYLDFGDGLSTYQYLTIQNCNALKTIVFGTGFTKIPPYAIYYARNLETIITRSTTPASADDYTFSNIGGSPYDRVTIQVPEGCVDTYKAAGGWKNFTKIIDGAEGGNGGEEGGNGNGGEEQKKNEIVYEGIKYIFEEGSTDLTLVAPVDNTLAGDITIPETIAQGDTTFTVVAVGESAFYEKKSITSVTLPESITSIGTSAFFGSGITSMVIPNSVTSLGTTTFSTCTALKTLVYGDGITTIDTENFSGCYDLEEVTFGTGFTSLPNLLFYYVYCDNLKKITSLSTTPPTCESFTFMGINYENVELEVPGEALEDYQAADGWKNFTKVAAGINTVGVDSDSNNVYYNLNGVKVSTDDITPGVYIIRNGAKSTKVLVK